MLLCFLSALLLPVLVELACLCRTLIVPTARVSRLASQLLPAPCVRCVRYLSGQSDALSCLAFCCFRVLYADRRILVIGVELPERVGGARVRAGVRPGGSNGALGAQSWYLTGLLDHSENN